MKPEVLVWALLFVLAVGLAYRFFDRAFRRMERAEDDSREAPEQLPETAIEWQTPIAETPKPSSVAAAPVTNTPPAPRRPVTVQPPSVPPSAQRAQPAAPPTRANETPPVILPRLVAAAAAAIATRDRTVIAAPDVSATLSPAVAVADTAPSLPLTTATPEVTVAIPVTIRWRGTRLRARRIGQEAPPLDQRIKDTRSRRVRRRSNARRKLAAMRKAPHKAPPRRVGTGPKGGDAFASAKATTRIVGMPQRAPRVRLAVRSLNLQNSN